MEFIVFYSKIQNFKEFNLDTAQYSLTIGLSVQFFKPMSHSVQIWTCMGKSQTHILTIVIYHTRKQHSQNCESCGFFFFKTHLCTQNFVHQGHHNIQIQLRCFTSKLMKTASMSNLHLQIWYRYQTARRIIMSNITMDNRGCPQSTLETKELFLRWLEAM